MANDIELTKEEKTLKNEIRGTLGAPILEYTLSIDGRVFLEQYLLNFNKRESEKKDITHWLDRFKCVNWIEGDENEDGVVSIPSQREKIRDIIKEVGTSVSSGAGSSFNSLTFNPSPALGSMSNITQNGQPIGECFLDAESYGIEVSLIEGTKISSFCLNDIVGAYSPLVPRVHVSNIHFCSINAKGVTFTGNTRLLVAPNSFFGTTPWFSGLFDFSGSTFEEDVVIQSIDYRIDTRSSTLHIRPLINFRACTFKKNVKIQDIRIQGTFSDAQISFEDTIIENNFTMFNANLGRAKLNCLQMILGTAVYCAPSRKSVLSNNIKLKNLSLEEGAQLDLSEVELRKGQIMLENIPFLYNTTLRFKKICQKPSDLGTCPEINVEIRNCTLKGILELCNIDKLYFHDFNNVGSIISTSKDKWGESSDKRKSCDRLVNALEKHLLDKAERTPSDINECARNLSMLKKNYELLGMNASEDAALITYMNNNNHPGQWCHPILKRVYWLLDKTGKYGTSPWRILILLSAIWFFSAIPLSFAFKQVCQALVVSLSNLLPFSSVFYSLLKIPDLSTRWQFWVSFICGLESVLGSLLLAYFAIAIVRRTMR